MSKFKLHNLLRFSTNINQKLSSPVTISSIRTQIYTSKHQKPEFHLDSAHDTIDANEQKHFLPVRSAKNDQSSLTSYDEISAKFVRLLIEDGRKKVAREILNKTFEKIKLIQLTKYHQETNEELKNEIICDPLKIFHEAVANCRPLLTTQRVKRGGVIYTVPIPAKPHYQLYKSITWLIKVCDDKDDNKRIWDKLAYELLNAANNEGRAIRRKHDLHRLCEANRAYAHFRW